MMAILTEVSWNLSVVFKKCHVFHFVFSPTKLESRRAEQVPPRVGRAGTSERGEILGKGDSRVNTVQ
jgi:hypothetical protein